MSRVRTAFLAAMSHEFRTPMNAVIGLSDLLLESALDTTNKAHVQTISDSARGLLAILNDILDFTKIDAQKLSLSPVPFDLGRLAASVVDMLRPAATTRAIALSLELDPAPPQCLLGDDMRLRQVLVNLVSNGIKFTDRGAVQLQLRLPAVTSPPNAYRSAPQSGAVGLRPLVILVVDDQPLNREVAQAKLGRLGYLVDLASNGPEAIARVATKQYDVIFMDLQMPGMSGIATTRHIVKSLAGQRLPHIIALTASVFEEDRRACLQAGMCDFIGKPIEYAQLDAVLNRVAAERAAPPPVAAAPLSPVAREKLMQIERNGEPDFVAKLSQIFLTDTRLRLPRMVAALTRSDAAELERQAHILRSASATVGATEMANLSGRIEEEVRQGRLEKIGALLEALVVQLPAVEQALRSAHAPMIL